MLTLTDGSAYVHTTSGAGPDGVCNFCKTDSNSNYQNKSWYFNDWSGYSDDDPLTITNQTGFKLNSGQILIEGKNIGAIDNSTSVCGKFSKSSFTTNSC